tara:strand:+ start:470 stop:793 length:324 start_codon:yes stop_codon:yes gene_type:complete
MKYYAKVSNGIVQRVIVAEPEFFNSFVDDSAGKWIETSIDSSFRKHYAGEGYIYDETKDIFYPPQPYPSWVLDSETYLWDAPVPFPSDGEPYDWDEETLSWIIVTPE